MKLNFTIFFQLSCSFPWPFHFCLNGRYLQMSATHDFEDPQAIFVRKLSLEAQKQPTKTIMNIKNSKTQIPLSSSALTSVIQKAWTPFTRNCFCKLAAIFAHLNFVSRHIFRNRDYAESKFDRITINHYQSLCDHWVCMDAWQKRKQNGDGSLSS